MQSITNYKSYASNHPILVAGVIGFTAAVCTGSLLIGGIAAGALYLISRTFAQSTRNFLLELNSMSKFIDQNTRLQIKQLYDSKRNNPGAFYRAIESLVSENKLTYRNGFFVIRAFDGGADRVTDAIRAKLDNKSITGKEAFYSLVKQKNIQIFEATRLRSNQDFKDETNTLQKRAEIIQRIPPRNPTKNENTLVAVEEKSTFEATKELVNRGFKPLVLDMANAYSAGGGVRKGSSAQEEHLCRQSNLFEGLEVLGNSRSPFLPPTGGAFLPKVVFHKDDQYENLSQPVVADVFASAAYNCNTQSRGADRPTSNAEYVNNTKEKIRTMFRKAIENGNDALVLSAFGCGAFKNDPVMIANLYNEILAEDEFYGQFKTIVFGIVNDHNGNANFQTFKRILVDEPQKKCVIF